MGRVSVKQFIKVKKVIFINDIGFRMFRFKSDYKQMNMIFGREKKHDNN
jgi:hypothetical protein